MSDLQFHPEPPPEITEGDTEEEEIATELAVLEDASLEQVTRRIEMLDAIIEDNVARVRLAEQLVGEELVEIDDGDFEDDEGLELDEPDDGEVDDNVDDDDDEWPEQEEHGWDLYDDTEMDL